MDNNNLLLQQQLQIQQQQIALQKQQQQQRISLNQIFERIREYIREDKLEELKKIITQYGILYQPIDANNLTMLHYAVQSGRRRIVEELSTLMFEKDGINVMDNFGRTPLHQASAKGDIAIIKTLILVSGDVNACTISGETPLMKAIAFYQLKAIKLLLRFGANPFLKNKLTNKNAVEQSLQMNNEEIIDTLKKYADVYKKIALVLMVYTSLGKTERKCSLNNLSVPVVQKLIKYIIP